MTSKIYDMFYFYCVNKALQRYTIPLFHYTNRKLILNSLTNALTILRIGFCFYQSNVNRHKAHTSSILTIRIFALVFH